MLNAGSKVTVFLSVKPNASQDYTMHMHSHCKVASATISHGMQSSERWSLIFSNCQPARSHLIRWLQHDLGHIRGVVATTVGHVIDGGDTASAWGAGGGHCQVSCLPLHCRGDGAGNGNGRGVVSGDCSCGDAH